MDRRPDSLQTTDAPVALGGLARALRERTRALHARAERSGVVHDVVRGCVSRHAYALLLRNLLPAYQQMERELDRHARTPGVRTIAWPVLYRANALAADLECLCGSAWSNTLPLLDAGDRYARRVALAAAGDGSRLIAHAYVRYLGDLSGGQLLRELLARSLGLEHRGLSFYDFPDIGDQDSFKMAYRDALNRAAYEITYVAAVIEEAAVSFQLNIEVSIAVQEAAAQANPTTRDH
jgi:heme oxygenase (biliverdin-producing, ferredoxin)